MPQTARGRSGAMRSRRRNPQTFRGTRTLWDTGPGRSGEGGATTGGGKRRRGHAQERDEIDWEDAPAPPPPDDEPRRRLIERANSFLRPYRLRLGDIG